MLVKFVYENQKDPTIFSLEIVLCKLFFVDECIARQIERVFIIHIKNQK
jgi:hypothetical protein